MKPKQLDNNNMMISVQKFLPLKRKIYKKFHETQRKIKLDNKNNHPEFIKKMTKVGDMLKELDDSKENFQFSERRIVSLIKFLIAAKEIFDLKNIIELIEEIDKFLGKPHILNIVNSRRIIDKTTLKFMIDLIMNIKEEFDEIQIKKRAPANHKFLELTSNQVIKICNSWSELGVNISIFPYEISSYLDFILEAQLIFVQENLVVDTREISELRATIFDFVNDIYELFDNHPALFMHQLTAKYIRTNMLFSKNIVINKSFYKSINKFLEFYSEYSTLNYNKLFLVQKISKTCVSSIIQLKNSLEKISELSLVRVLINCIVEVIKIYRDLSASFFQENNISHVSAYADFIQYVCYSNKIIFESTMMNKKSEEYKFNVKIVYRFHSVIMDNKSLKLESEPHLAILKLFKDFIALTQDGAHLKLRAKLMEMLLDLTPQVVSTNGTVSQDDLKKLTIKLERIKGHNQNLNRSFTEKKAKEIELRQKNKELEEKLKTKGADSESRIGLAEFELLTISNQRNLELKSEIKKLRVEKQTESEKLTSTIQELKSLVDKKSRGFYTVLGKLQKMERLQNKTQGEKMMEQVRNSTQFKYFKHVSTILETEIHRLNAEIEQLENRQPVYLVHQPVYLIPASQPTWQPQFTYDQHNYYDETGSEPVSYPGYY